MYPNQGNGGPGQVGALSIQDNLTPQGHGRALPQMIPNVNMQQTGGDPAPHISGQPIANMGAQDLSQM